MIEDVENPLICNNEGLNVNQIKKKEYLLRDSTRCPWLVLYIQKGVLGTTNAGIDGIVTINVDENDGSVYETLQTPIDQWQYYDYADDPSNNYTHTATYKTSDNCDIVFRVCFNQRIGQCEQYKISKMNGSTCKMAAWTTNYPNLEKNDWWGATETARTALDAQYKNHYSTIYNDYKNVLGVLSYNSIVKYNNKIIKDSNGKYYKVTVTPKKEQSVGWYRITDDAATFKAHMSSYWNAAAGQSASPNNNCFAVTYKYQEVVIALEEQTDIETAIDFTNAAYTGNGTVDSPLYDVLCMPYGRISYHDPLGLFYGLYSSADRSLKVMSDIARQLGSGNNGSGYAIDLQILPYCPCQELILNSRPSLMFYDIPNSALLGKKNNVVTDVILVANNINYTLDITEAWDDWSLTGVYPIAIEDNSNVPDTWKKKYINDCTMLRLCSPNYNGLFEMNLAKNDMSIERFNVDVTMKPFTPYIHVNPDFKGLYGQDWNDIRGLVCNGDFSVGMLKDAWIQYEIQNRNYQSIFDRQIQNMDRMNAIARQEAAFQIAGGTVQGASNGAIAGYMGSGGNAYAAAAGAAIGGLSSLGGGIMDFVNLQKRQQENRSFAIDNFNLSLGNIKALPYSISKTSALTANNKLFPFVEIYECTDVEKEAYYNKIRYDGMTIGVIDTISNYRSDSSSNYFKGQLIRNTGIKASTHEVEEINNELMKGVYI